MRVGGKELKNLATVVVRLPRGGEEENALVLTVSALPLGFDDSQDELFPDPVAPKRLVRDGKGNVLRDGTKENRALFEPDFTNPEYRAQATLQDRRKMVLLVYMALRNDPTVEFETTDRFKLEEQPNQFCDSLWREMQEAGITMGDIGIIQAAALLVSNIDKERIKEVRASFLPSQT